MKTNRRSAILLTAEFFMLVGVTFTIASMWQASRALRGARQEVAAEDNLKFVSRAYLPAMDAGFEWVSSPALFSEAAEFNGNLYVAGPTGLFEYDARGHLLREFHVGRELPSSPLQRVGRATLADSRQPELLIATLDAGVLSFDGRGFRQILPESRDSRSITCLLPGPSGHLLIGTTKRGVLVYDGQRLSPFHSTLTDVHVTELAGSESDLWVGTKDRGVAHWHGGSAEWFGESDGLPDATVYAIALAGERAYVGTATGIAEFKDGRFARVLAAGAFVRSLLIRKNALLAGTMDDGLLEIPVAPSETHSPWGLGAIGDVREVGQIFQSGDSIYAVSPRGVFARIGPGNWRGVLNPEGGTLADRNVSALAADRAGRLWIGYFDRGLDIVDGFESGRVQHARHFEDDHLFCINRILPNARPEVTAIATANGLVMFDSQGIRRQVLGRHEGLIADHVTDVAQYGDGIAVSTPAGLTFLDSGGARSIYAFHGLVNNHVYALAADGHRLFAGTLGGASLFDHEEVRANFTTATSTLKHNWITAAVRAGEEWWIGTYGAGVMHMSDKEPGRFESANGAAGDLVINPDAMLVTNRLILAGTMGHGLYVMDRTSERWWAVDSGLPSMNVTALTAANGYVYVGTDNGLVRIAEERLVR